MSILDLDYRQNRQNINALKENINTVVPFLGAGASMPYGYPSWSDLLLKVLTSIRSDMTDNDYKKVMNYIDEKRYMEATEEMYECWPNLEDYVHYVISTIRPNFGSCLEKYIHLFPSKLYLTTNYDAVVEVILRLNFRNLNVISSPTESNKGLKSGEVPTLCYLHGKYIDPDFIVFSNVSYNYAYGRLDEITNIRSVNKHPLARKLHDVYSRNPLLFIGCSLNIEEDRILKLLKIFNQRIQQPENFSYALLDAEGLTSEQIEFKDAQLVKIRVCPIWYSSANEKNNHEQAKNDLFEHILGEEREKYEVWYKSKQEENEMRQKVQEENEKKLKAQEEEEKELKKSKKEIKEPLIKDSFKYHQRYNKTDRDYEFILTEINNKYYLSEQGRTYEMLDKVFELKEPDVIKNLKAIASECKVLIVEYDSPVDTVLFVPLESWSDLPEDKQKQLLKEAKCKLFTCVSFMDKMHIFYR